MSNAKMQLNYDVDELIFDQHYENFSALPCNLIISWQCTDIRSSLTTMYLN